MVKVKSLGFSGTIVVGVGENKDGRHLKADDIDTGGDKIAYRFGAGITRHADATGQWINPTIGRQVVEPCRVYTVTGKTATEVHEHAEFIADAFNQHSVFLTIGPHAYEVEGSA